jgi:integrase
MQGMIQQLGPRGNRRWEILDAIRDNKLTLPEVYDAYARQDLDGLLSSSNDELLFPYLDGWSQWVKSRRGDTGTHRTYLAQVSTLIDTNFRASGLTVDRVDEWLTNLPNVTPGTRRKYLYGLSSFCGYLRKRHVIQNDVLEGVERPRKNPPRMRYETLERIVSLFDAQEEPFRSLSAFIHATGSELSPALALRRRDLDLVRMKAHIPGTKTVQRNRHDVVISRWAKPILVAHCANLLPDAPLFPGISRYQAYWSHMKACKTVQIENYTLHDARHSWAVRAIRAGATFEVVRLQLGHTTTAQVATVYGRFTPSDEERTSWEAVAERQEQRGEAKSLGRIAL